MKIEIMNDRIVLNNVISVYNDGEKYSYNNMGQYHNVDGPAREYADGDESWFFESKRHRKYGPARKWRSGSYIWWFEDNYYSMEEFMERFL